MAKKNTKLTVRDGMARINGDSQTHTFDGIEIVSEDNMTLFSIERAENGGIEIRASGSVMIGGQVHGDAISIAPRASNVVYVFRLPVRHG